MLTSDVALYSAADTVRRIRVDARRSAAEPSKGVCDVRVQQT